MSSVATLPAVTVSASRIVAPKSAVSVSAIRPVATINGHEIPIFAFDCQTGAYGSVGRFTFQTTITSLAKAGFGPNNLLSRYMATAQPSLADGSPSLPVQISVNGAYGQPTQPIFGGDLDAVTWDFDQDEVTVEGRDYSGRMRDWRLSITTGLAHMTVAKFAQYVATAMKLKLSLATPSTQQNKELGYLLYQALGSATPGELNPLSGTSMPALWTRPQEMWALLNYLARAIGWDVHTTADGTIYFGPPQYEGTSPRTFTWGAAETTHNIIPIRNLSVLHQPHRYGTFKVLIMSYHNPSLRMGSATSIHVQAGFTAPTGKYIPAGVYTNADALASDIEDGKPNYSYYLPGLTPPQIQQIALSAAMDLAKRLYVVEGEIDGDPTLLPQMSIQLNEAISGSLQGYAGVPLNLVSVNHTFSMTEGYITHLKAWYAPSGPTEYGASARTSFGVG